MDDESTHEQLMVLFKTYFVENQKWARQKTHTSGIKVRKALADIRILARKRRAEIQESRYEKRAEKSNSGIEDNNKA